jgi:hypothetical protein
MDRDPESPCVSQADSEFDQRLHRILASSPARPVPAPAPDFGAERSEARRAIAEMRGGGQHEGVRHLLPCTHQHVHLIDVIVLLIINNIIIIIVVVVVVVLLSSSPS